MKHKLIRFTAIMTFISLISAYVMYRSGIIADEDIIQLSPNGGVVNSVKTDTSAHKPNFDNMTIMSSSKSMMVLDLQKITKDTIQSNQEPDSVIKKRIEIMSSSKSGIIFPPHNKRDTAEAKPTNK